MCTAPPRSAQGWVRLCTGLWRGDGPGSVLSGPGSSALDQRRELRVLLDPGADELAPRHHPEVAAAAHVLEGEADDRGADALSLVGVVDLGVGEDDPVAVELVGREAGQLTVHAPLVALLVGLVARLHVAYAASLRPGCQRPRARSRRTTRVRRVLEPVHRDGRE